MRGLLKRSGPPAVPKPAPRAVIAQPEGMNPASPSTVPCEQLPRNRYDPRVHNGRVPLFRTQVQSPERALRLERIWW